jgi:hypothetical protein
VWFFSACPSPPSTPYTLDTHAAIIPPTSVGHAQHSRAQVPQLEVLISKPGGGGRSITSTTARPYMHSQCHRLHMLAAYAQCCCSTLSAQLG